MSETRGTREPIKIRNRDVLLLSRVLYTMQAVSATEEKRLWQQDRLWHITQKIIGMPGGGGEPSGLDKHFAAIAEIEERYEQELSDYDDALQTAEAILNAIPSPKLRTFVTMLYVLNIPNREIMTRLNMRRKTFDGLRRSIEQAQDMKSVIWHERFTLK